MSPKKARPSSSEELSTQRVQESSQKSILSDFSDAQLQDELKKREEARQREKAAKHLERMNRLQAVLKTNNGLIDILAHKHDRTNCSDGLPINGVDSNEDGSPRCKRCSLIDIKDGKFLSADIDLTVTFDRSWP